MHKLYSLQHPVGGCIVLQHAALDFYIYFPLSLHSILVNSLSRYSLCCDILYGIINWDLACFLSVLLMCISPYCQVLSYLELLPWILVVLASIPKYYLKRHDVNVVFKVDLPDHWRLVYGITAIHNEKKALLMELFDHEKYNRRFGY